MSRPSHAWTMLLAAAGLAGLTAFSVAGPQDSEPTKAQKIAPPEWSKQFTALKVGEGCAVRDNNSESVIAAKKGGLSRPMPSGYFMAETNGTCRISNPDNQLCFFRPNREPNCYAKPSKPSGP